MKKYILRFRKGDKEMFEMVRSGLKSIETRAGTVRYQPIQKGDEIIFVCGNDRFSKVIKKKYHWPSVGAMIQKIPFKNIMPQAQSVEDLKKAYQSYPGYTEKIKGRGLFGFEFE